MALTKSQLSAQWDTTSGNDDASAPDSMEETSSSGSNTGLPFGLCKKFGIPIGENWTPHDAWNALEKRGIEPPWKAGWMYGEDGKLKTKLPFDNHRLGKPVGVMQIPDWLAEKIGREKRLKYTPNTHIYAIVGETEKAYKVFLENGDNLELVWVPKSVVKTTPLTEKSSPLSNPQWYTFQFDDFATAMAYKSELQKKWWREAHVD